MLYLCIDGIYIYLSILFVIIFYAIIKDIKMPKWKLLIAAIIMGLMWPCAIIVLLLYRLLTIGERNAK